VWYNFGKVIKTVATKCNILKLKCTKFDFGWGNLQHSPDPLAGFKGFKRDYLYKGKEGRGRERKGKGEGKGERVWGGEVEREVVDIAWPDL